MLLLARSCLMLVIYRKLPELIFIDRIAGVIIRLIASMCVHVSVRLSLSTLLFEPFDI